MPNIEVFRYTTERITMKKFTIVTILIILFAKNAMCNYIFVPMDNTQNNHLKAYGFVYWLLEQDVSTDWLLNYQGGSFMVKYADPIAKELKIRGISFNVISDGQSNQILQDISNPESNMDAMTLDVAPKIAVYSPKSKQPWDDAVTLVLTYAEIPYDIVFDDEVLTGELNKYDWLHLHHEDFTGQYDKFWAFYRTKPWFIERKNEYEAMAEKHGFKDVPALKLGVSKKIKAYCAGGGFLFAMCTATDTYDISLAADGVDIVDHMFDGTPPESGFQNKLNYNNTVAFKDFKVYPQATLNEFSNIDNQYKERGLNEKNDFFQLFEFSAKWDPVPTMLTQNHEKVINGFMGQTTGYKKELIKSHVIILAENQTINEAKYIHGTLGKGQWTFYGGHDPEDYQHFVGEEPTNLELHPQSPGYRLILNNILFPAAKKKKRKT